MVAGITLLVGVAGALLTMSQRAPAPVVSPVKSALIRVEAGTVSATITGYVPASMERVIEVAPPPPEKRRKQRPASKTPNRTAVPVRVFREPKVQFASKTSSVAKKPVLANKKDPSKTQIQRQNQEVDTLSRDVAAIKLKLQRRRLAKLDKVAKLKGWTFLRGPTEGEPGWKLWREWRELDFLFRPPKSKAKR